MTIAYPSGQMDALYVDVKKCLISKYTNPHFDIRHFLTFATNIKDNISQYREVWKRTLEKECIDNLHKITFHNQYGVIGICHDCSIVHGFNYITPLDNYNAYFYIVYNI
jgi:hypothetical protein